MIDLHISLLPGNYLVLYDWLPGKMEKSELKCKSCNKTTQLIKKLKESIMKLLLNIKKGIYQSHRNLRKRIIVKLVNIHHFSIVNIIVCILFTASFNNSNGQASKTGKPVKYSFLIPEDYLREPESIPAFWITTVEDVTKFLKEHVQKGEVEVIGTSAGGRPIRAVFYGKPRQGNGTTTFSGSLGFGNVRAYRGSDHEKTVYMAFAGVHGGEFEGIVGLVNLLSVIESGKDLRGKEWPEINEVVSRLDRIILIPILNPDGRERVPLSMEAYRGDTNGVIAEFLNTGGKPDGAITGWPKIKEFIPMDFSLPGFPGGYPNDAGVNCQHDDFLGDIQPETQALFDLTKREKPDLILNMHTGAVSMRMDRPLCEPVLSTAFDELFAYVNSRWALEGYLNTKDPKVESDPKRANQSGYNLDCALNLHCGALCVVVESPSHAFTVRNYKRLTPDRIIDSQLFCYLEAMRFLAETGGRSAWTPGRKP